MHHATPAVVLLCAMAVPSCGAGGDVESEDVVATASSSLKHEDQRVLVCHLPGGDRFKAHEILIASSAVAAHLAHGDVAGACSAWIRAEDGSVCTDDNACTSGDTSWNGQCVPGTPMFCPAGPTCVGIGTCDPAVGNCTYNTPPPDGTACDDDNICTEGEVCTQGSCGGGATPGIVTNGDTTTFACPATAIADDGVVQRTCAFPASFSPNNIFSGEVFLISHLARPFANFDVHTLPNGDLQLVCVYANADGLQIGGITRFPVRLPGGCSATANSFVCTH
jgi:hypothetical protein